MNAADVRFNNAGTVQLFKAAQGYDTDAAAALIRDYRGDIPPEVYLDGFKQFYTNGKEGLSYADIIENNLYADYLSSETAQAAYEAGIEAKIRAGVFDSKKGLGETSPFAKSGEFAENGEAASLPSVDGEEESGYNGGDGAGEKAKSFKVNTGQQDKHIPGTNNYEQSITKGIKRSILKENPQQLLDEFAGKGQKLGINKERVNFGRVIGQYYDDFTGKYVDTTNGIIHYDSKGGAYIVPSRT